MKYRIRVTANSSSEEVYQDEDMILVRVKSPSREGKANDAVIKLLAKYFHVPQNSVRIVSGHKGRNKVVEIL
ncbi:MAG: DUF167 domain-containing protein [Chloroflexota bacterium]|nr:DUF167 domain-containing protein [Chloroflexota bacterium]